MDIVLYMNQEDFFHKTSGSYKTRDNITAYWSMTRIPKKFTENDKIFVATKGNIMGYVECEEFRPEDIGGETIIWESDTFTYIVSIPCKQFRGFRYRWFEYEQKES